MGVRDGAAQSGGAVPSGAAQAEARLLVVEDDPNILVDMSTDNNMLVNSGMTGILSWRVPYSIMRWVKISSGVLDILAIADGHRVNLFQEAGPAEVIVRSGVTIPKLL